MAKEAGNRRILVVDDEQEVVDLVRIMLEQEGCTILEANDGEQALARARSDLPDLIMLDVRMPRMDGMTTLRNLHADPVLADIPVIMLSVVTTYPDVRAALQQGAIAYLSKPFELREMVRLVIDVLGMDDTQREALRQRAMTSVAQPW